MIAKALSTLRRPVLWGLAAFALGALLSYWFALGVEQYNRQKINSLVLREANRLARVTEQRVSLYDNGLFAMRTYVLSSKFNATKDDFARFVASLNIDREFPGARGFGIVWRVPEDQVDNFVARARADGFAVFAIKELGDASGDKYVIRQLEPLERNLAAIGLNIASEPRRRVAAEKSAESGEVRITEPITLLQAQNNLQQSFLILLPFYDTWDAPNSPQARMAKVRGWVYAPLLSSEILEGADINSQYFSVVLNDVDAVHAQTFFDTHSPGNQLGAFVQSASFYVFGRSWRITVTPTVEYIKGLGVVRFQTVFGIGLFISSLLGLLLAGVAFNRQQKNVLDIREASLEAIVSSTLDAIIGVDSHGNITHWNRGAQLTFGYATSEVLGRDVIELLVPENEKPVAREKFQQALAGSVVEPYVSMRVTKPGTIIDVLTGIVPIKDARGQIAGFCKTIRNITQIKTFERELIELNTTLETRILQRTRELDATKQNLESLLNAIPISISQWTMGLANSFANLACLKRFSLTEAQIKASHLYRLWPHRQWQDMNPLIEKVLRGDMQTTEYKLEDGGGVRDYIIQFVPDKVAGVVIGFYYIEFDISELAESQRLLRESRRENKALLDLISEQFHLSITDISGAILDVNDLFCRSSGFTREEIVGQNHRIFSSGHHSPLFWQDLWQTLNAGKTWRGEICNKSKSGVLSWYDTVISPYMDSDGKTSRFISLRSDITARKEAEAGREAIGKLLQETVDATEQVSVIATDLNGTITIFNRGAEKLLGYRAREMVGVNTPAVIHLPEEIAARGRELSAEYGEEIQGFDVFVYKSNRGEAETRRWTYVRKNGSQFPVSLSVAVIRDANGRDIGYVGFAIDISQTLAFERDLALVRDQLAIAIQVAKLGIWSWDTATDQLWWNDHTYEIFEQPLVLKRQGLVFSHWSDRVHPEDLAATKSLLLRAVKGEAEFDCIYRVLAPSGEKYVQAAAQIERNSKGDAVKVTGICLDVTERYLSELHLRNAKVAADQAAQAKSDFLANMSHEIRTPMNAVLGMLQLMRGTQLTHHQEDYVFKAQSAAKTLLGILNDILDFSKIEAGKLQLDPVHFEMDDLLRDLSVVMAGLHKSKLVEVLFELAPDLPLAVVGDRLRLQQVLVNLCSNALKFTSEGYVKIQVMLKGKQRSGWQIGFCVEDTGIGISEEQQSKLFQSFTQAEASTTRRFGGTGLGLSISNRLVDLMGGTLRVESQPGKGSRFYFDIRMQVNDQEPVGIVSELGSKSLRVLMVDDSELLLESMATQLARYGWDIHRAGDGREALNVITQAQLQGQPFDAVVTDWFMPRLDGLTLIKQLEQQLPRKLPSIFMLTGSEREMLGKLPEQDQMLFSEIVIKPVTPKQLAESVWLARFGQSRRVEIEEPKPLAGLSLLVVEDNELNRQVAKELIERAGAQVDLAECGVEGVSKVLAQERAYDLVIMDLQMPDIDGLEATRRIRSSGKFPELPILAMTANVTASDRQRCLEAGMNDHIGKPIDMDQVVPRLLALTGRIQIPADDAPAPAQAEEPLIESRQKILARFNNNSALYDAMAGRFVPEVQKLWQKYEEARVANQIEKAALAVHSIRGVAATLGATKLARIAGEVEKSIKDGHWPAEQRLSDFAGLVEQTCKAFDAR